MAKILSSCSVKKIKNKEYIKKKAQLNKNKMENIIFYWQASGLNENIITIKTITI